MQDATSLAAAIAAGRTTAGAVMAAALAAAEARAGLGAVTRLDADRGRATAAAFDAAPTAGPFAGVPFLGKDLGSGAAGLTPAAGSPALRRRLGESGGDSALFARFRAAGLVPFGLSTVPEFGLSLTSEPPGAAPARNPFDPALSPGGSSGGAAAAVAGGIVAIAHATDAAGSIRVPAACCGLAGLKPSRGAMPGGPDFNNHLMGLAGELVLARSVRDLAAAFAACAVTTRAGAPAVVAIGPTPRVALCSGGPVGADQAGAARTAAAALAALGCAVAERAFPAGLAAEASGLARTVLFASMAEWLDAAGIADAEVTPISAAAAAEGRAMGAPALFAAGRSLARLTRDVAELFADTDLLLWPVLSGPPPVVGAFDPGRTDPAARFAQMETLAPGAALANAAGCPALALPFGTDAAGLPVGVQLMGPVGSDRAVLALGARLQAAAPAIAFPHAIAGHP